MLQVLDRILPVHIHAANGNVTFSISVPKSKSAHFYKIQDNEFVDEVSETDEGLKITLNGAFSLFGNDKVSAAQSIESTCLNIGKLIDFYFNLVTKRIADSVPTVLMLENMGSIRFMELPPIEMDTADFITNITKDIVSKIGMLCQSNVQLFEHAALVAKNPNPILNLKRFGDRLRIVLSITNRFAHEVIPTSYSDADALFTGLLTIRKDYLRKIVSFSGKHGDNVRYIVRTFSEDPFEYKSLVQGFIIPVLNHHGIRSEYIASKKENECSDSNAIFLSYDLSINLDSFLQFYSTPQFVYVYGRFPYEVNDTALKKLTTTNGISNTTISKYTPIEIERFTDSDFLTIASSLLVRTDSSAHNMLWSLSSSAQFCYSDAAQCLHSMVYQGILSLRRERQWFEFSIYNANLTLKEIIDLPRRHAEVAVLRVLALAVSPLSIDELSAVMEYLGEYTPDTLPILSSVIRALEEQSRLVVSEKEIEAIRGTAISVIRHSIEMDIKERLRIVDALSWVCQSTRPVEHAYYSTVEMVSLDAKSIKLTASAIKGNPQNQRVPLLLKTVEVKIPKHLHRSQEVLEFHSAAAMFYKSQCDVEPLSRILNFVKSTYPRDFELWAEYVLALVYALKRIQRYDQAIDEGIKYLAKLGFKIPTRPSKSDVLWRYMKARARLGFFGPFPQPRMTESSRILIVNRVVEQVASASYMSGQKLFPLLMSTSVEICLEHGAAPESSFGFAAFASVCRELSGFNSYIGSSDGAEHLLRYAKSYAQLISREYDTRINLIENGFITHWRVCQVEAANSLLRAHENDAGKDPEYALYSAAIGACLAFCRGMPLHEIRLKIDVPIIHARHFGQATSLSNLLIIAQFIELLGDGELSETAYANVPKLTRPWQSETSAFDRTVTCVYLTLRATLAVLDRDYSEAKKIVVHALSYSEAVQGQQLISLMRFIDAWTSSHLDRSEVSLLQIKNRKQFNRQMDWFKAWRKDSPANAQTYVFALQAAAKKDHRQRLVHLKVALESAKSDENWLLAAIISDAYMMHSDTFGTRDESDRALIEHLNALDRWGAYARASNLRSRHSKPTGTRKSDVEEAAVFSRFNKLIQILNSAHYPRVILSELIKHVQDSRNIASVEIYEFDLAYGKLKRHNFLNYPRQSSDGIDIPETPIHHEMLKLSEGGSFSINNRLVLGLYQSKNRTVVLDLTASSGRLAPDDMYIRFFCGLLKHVIGACYLEDQLSTKTSQLKRLADTQDMPTEQNKRYANICSYFASHIDRCSQTMCDHFEGASDKHMLSQMSQAFKRDRQFIKCTFIHLNDFSSIKPLKILYVYDDHPRFPIETGMLEAAGHSFQQVKFCAVEYNSLGTTDYQVIIVDCRNEGNFIDALEQFSAISFTSRPLLIQTDSCLGGGRLARQLFSHVVKSDATIAEWLHFAYKSNRKPTLRAVSNKVV